MPKNKTQRIIFGIIMSYSMAVGMEIYNNAIQQGVHLQPGGFSYTINIQHLLSLVKLLNPRRIHRNVRL